VAPLTTTVRKVRMATIRLTTVSVVVIAVWEFALVHAVAAKDGTYPMFGQRYTYIKLYGTRLAVEAQECNCDKAV
jgi:hypothetical protein